MIIYGWGRKKITRFGPRRSCHCNNCNNDSYWELIKVSTWFSLFFIPVIPYDTKRLLMCPVCNSCVELSNEEFKQLKNVNVSDSKEIDYYGKNETQINFLKETRDSIEEKNDIKIESNNQTVVLNENAIQNNNVMNMEASDDTVSVWTRLFAKAIDCMLIIVAYLILAADSETLKVIGLLLLVSIGVVQLTLLAILGQTIGKKICKIKIVKVNTNTNGGFITNCLLRSILNNILYTTVIYAIVDGVCIVREDRRCIHDFIAGTKVVKEESSGQVIHNNFSGMQTENSIKNRRMKKVLIATFGIFIFVFVGYRFSVSIENAREKKAYNYIKTLSQNSNEGKQLKIMKAESKSYGKLALLVKVVNEDINKTNSMHKEFTQGFKEKTSEDKFPRGLTSREFFKDIDTIKQTRKNLKEVNDFLAKYEVDIKKNKDNTDKKLADLKRLNTEAEEQSIDIYNSSRKERYNKNIQTINSEKTYVKKLDKCFEFMESKQGQYEFGDGKIIFYSQSDVDTWNSLVADIKRTTKSENKSMLL